MKLQLAENHSLSSENNRSTITTARGPVRFSDLSQTQSMALTQLAEGATERELVGMLPDIEEQIWIRMIIDRLVSLGILLRSHESGLRIEVIGDGYQSNGRKLGPEQTFRISKFCYLRRDGDDLILESPRTLSRLCVTDPSVVLPILAKIVAPKTLQQLGSDDGVEGELIQVLFQEGFLEPVGPVPQDNAEAMALQEWSFHDLLFHSRSRQGRHRYPYGASYRYEGVREPLPAVTEIAKEEQVTPLPRPDIAQLRERDPGFAEVLESRRSWRTIGPEPMTSEQLGEFLFRAARVRGRRGTEHEEISNRPYPGGGADYELEIYLLVNRVVGIDRGLYRYDPLGHQLVHVSEWNDLIEAIALDTCRKAPPGEIPDVQFAITARMMRLTYKYDSIPYSIALKDTGVLLQTFYLCATAMGLAPCAVGGGNSELFARAAGLSPFVEPQVGEFLLNTQNPAETSDVPLSW